MTVYTHQPPSLVKCADKTTRRPVFLAADDEAELHRFATLLGLTKWSTRYNAAMIRYELTPEQGAKATARGAVRTTAKQYARVMFNNRTGPMPEGEVYLR